MTKKEMTARCREILYSDEEIVGEDFDFLLGILSRHSEAESKIGEGIKHFWSEQNPVYKHTRCFYLERLDGSTTDFSFTHCISPKNDFKSACRNAIHYQIKAFREANNMDRTRHADHDPESFDSILDRFVKLNGKCKVNETKDHSYGCELVDQEYKNKWCDFHQQEAVLRNISWQENLTKKRNVIS